MQYIFSNGDTIFKRRLFLIFNYLFSGKKELCDDDFQKLAKFICVGNDIVCAIVCVNICLQSRPPRTKMQALMEWHKKLWGDNLIPDKLKSILKSADSNTCTYINSIQEFQSYSWFDFYEIFIKLLTRAIQLMLPKLEISMHIFV